MSEVSGVSKSGHYPTQQEMWQLEHYLQSNDQKTDQVSNAWVDKGLITAVIGQGLQARHIELRISEKPKPSSGRVFSGFCLALIIAILGLKSVVSIGLDVYLHDPTNYITARSIVLFVALPCVSLLSGLIGAALAKAYGAFIGLFAGFAMFSVGGADLSIAEGWVITGLILLLGLIGGIIGQKIAES
jgi:hypothetical protein